MDTFIVILIIVAVLSASITKIVIEKKRGNKCIGCSSCQVSTNKKQQSCCK